MLKRTALALASLSILYATPAFAIDEIYSPISEPGELSLEYNGNNTFDHHHDKNNVSEQEMELEWGVNNFWTTQLATSYEKASGESLKMDAVEWENRFQFLPQGEYWVDVGGLIAYDYTVHSKDPDSLELKLLLQKDTGMFTHMLNVGIEKEVGRHSGPSPDRTLAWSTRYRMNEYFQPGFELQSDLGTASGNDRWQTQEHYFGPAIYGKITPQLKYEAAYYVGISDAAAQSAARMKLEYEMHF